MTFIRPMPREAYPAFFEDAVAIYAEQNITGGRWLAKDAPALARAETTRLLPQGVETPDNYLFEIVDDVTTRVVGYVWFSASSRGSIWIAFVAQVTIYPEFQGHGHAKAALNLVEEKARELGLAGMGLHVFAFNKAARGLYESTGFEVSSLHMIKPFVCSNA